MYVYRGDSEAESGFEGGMEDADAMGQSWGRMSSKVGGEGGRRRRRSRSNSGGGREGEEWGEDEEGEADASAVESDLEQRVRSGRGARADISRGGG